MLGQAGHDDLRRLELAGDQVDDRGSGVERGGVDAEHPGGRDAGQEQPPAHRLHLVQVGGGSRVVEHHGDQRAAFALGERGGRGDEAAVPDVHAVELTDDHDRVAGGAGVDVHSASEYAARRSGRHGRLDRSDDLAERHVADPPARAQSR